MLFLSAFSSAISSSRSSSCSLHTLSSLVSAANSWKTGQMLSSSQGSRRGSPGLGQGVTLQGKRSDPEPSPQTTSLRLPGRHSMERNSSEVIKIICQHHISLHFKFFSLKRNKEGTKLHLIINLTFKLRKVVDVDDSRQFANRWYIQVLA